MLQILKKSEFILYLIRELFKYKEKVNFIEFNEIERKILETLKLPKKEYDCQKIQKFLKTAKTKTF
jgi:hypothetical protein